jgi:hypothetical protein
MKLRVLTILVCLIQLTSFAQRFGIEAGYAYGLNSFKNLDSLEDSNYGNYDVEEHFKQSSFPNFSFSSYINCIKRFISV